MKVITLKLDDIRQKISSILSDNLASEYYVDFFKKKIKNNQTLYLGQTNEKLGVIKEVMITIEPKVSHYGFNKSFWNVSSIFHRFQYVKTN